AEGRDTPPARPSAPPVPTPHRGRRRAVFVGLATLVLVLLGAGAGWTYVRSQYYVGLDGDQVAVFRGVSGSIAGVPLQEVQVRTPLSRDRLSEIEQQRLADGIVAVNQRDAQAIVERLLTAADCSTLAPGPTPSAGASPRPSATPTASSAPGPAATASPCP
ncbi:MAG: protein serine/threonine phosphatase, partial [Frankiales bacterium]|nr:protein serine/threonine phosphatase [Frankiales bacterium]